MCEYNPRLTLSASLFSFLFVFVILLIRSFSALDLSIALPTTLGVLSKWAAESVRHIYLPSTTFIANVKGYPVLPKPTQQFIKDSMIASILFSYISLNLGFNLCLRDFQHQPVIILAGVSEGHHARGGEAAYSQYVRHLERTSPVVRAAERAGTVENFAKGYQDYLQAPLQVFLHLYVRTERT
jgi:protein arginine N-methyltransferase 5